MSAEPTRREGVPPTPSLLHLNALCDRFEADWRAGRRPSVDVLLAAVEEPLRARLCRELLQLDAHYRRLAGEVPRPEDYALEVPLLSTQEIAALLVGDSSPQPGDLVGDYELLEPLGRGGMGVVSRARHRWLGRIVAIKLLRRDLLDDAALRRFRREIEAVGRLDHPNVVAALDASPDEACPFLVMEYVEGTDLERLVKGEGPRPIAEAGDAVRQAALGLQHAFERGIIHRDVKPSNLLRTSAGVVKVLDLGLAQLRRQGGDGSDSGLTPAGAVLGTPDYLAPEQARDARQADVRADVYGLGCTLYFLLAGQPPFPGGTLVEKLVRHQTEEATPIERLRPEVPATLAAIVRRAMARRPEDRFGTPAEFAAALEPTPAPRRRTSRLAWAIVGLGGLLLVGDLVVPLFQDRESPFLFDKDTSKASGSHAPAGNMTLGDPRWRLWDEVEAVAVSADGRLAAAGGRDRCIRVWHCDGSASAREYPVEAGVLALQFMPDGTLLAGLDQGSILRIDPHSQTVPRPGPAVRNPRSLSALAFSPDGLRVVAGNQEGLILLKGVDDPTPFVERGRHSKSVSRVVFAPNGQQVATSSEDGTVKVWETRSLDPPRTFDAESGPVWDVAFHPQRQILAAAYGNDRIKVWDLATGLAQEEFQGQKDIISALSFSRDGVLLASAGQQGTLLVREWESGVMHQLPGHSDRTRALTFAPGDAFLISGSADRSVRRWAPKSRKELDPPVGHRSSVLSVAFTNDGRTVVTGGRDGSVYLWDPELGSVHASRPPDLRNVIHTVAVSPGDRLVRAYLYGLQVFDLKTMKEVSTGQLKRQSPRFLCHLPGREAVCGGDQTTLKVWDLENGQDKATLLLPHSMTALAPSPEGRLIAVATGRLGDPVEVRLWNWENEQIEGHPLRLGKEPIHCLAFAQDGRLLTVARGDGELLQLDVRTGLPHRTLPGHEARILAVASAPSGRLASADVRGVVLLWGETSREPRQRWQFPGAIHALAFSPDGRRLATGNSDGTVFLLSPNRE